MKLFGQIVAWFFSIVLLGAMGFAAYLVLEYAVTLLASLDRQVGIVTGIACVVVLAASWWIARAIRAASQQSKALTLRDEKTATYQLFVEFWENLLRQKLARSDQFSDKLKVLERLLALYGGAGVVKAHTALRDKERDKGAQHADVRALLGEALAAIRSDLGVDTPRHIAGALEQLILPACDAEGGAAEIRDEPGRAVLAPNP